MPSTRDGPGVGSLTFTCDLPICPLYALRQMSTTLRLLRLTRIARVFKVAKYSFAVRSFFVAVSQSMYSLVVLLLVIGIVILLFGSALFYAEESVDPALRYDKCGAKCFSSIISASWSVVSAVTTAGYGDSYPISAFGKFIVGAAAFVGVVVLALPIAVFEDNFNKVYRARAVCHKMVKTLTRHRDVPIDVPVVEQWIDTEIMMGRFAREPGIGSALKGFLGQGKGVAPTMRPVIARDAIARLDAAAIVQNYDVQGRGFLVEGEALMMIADINEHHAPEDTTKINASLMQMADFLAHSIEKSLTAIEQRHVGHEYSLEQKKKVGEIWAPVPLEGKVKLQKTKSSKSLAWTPPEVDKPARGNTRKVGDNPEPVQEMDEDGWIEWTERLEASQTDEL